jgi:GTP pyrophosphokinase
MVESRELLLEQQLSVLGFNDALRALDLMRKEMCAEKGFTRHNGEHYYYHLVDVTQDLINHGVRYEPCIVAALLHDYMEDVAGVTFRMIETLFGTEVAQYVYLLSKNPEIDYHNKENMIGYLQDIGDYLWTALIKTSDRKHNFSQLKDASFEKRMKQAIETETYFIPAFKEWRNKFPRYAPYFFGAKTSIEPHLWAIKEYHAEIERLQDKIFHLGRKIEDYHCDVC